MQAFWIPEAGRSREAGSAGKAPWCSRAAKLWILPLALAVSGGGCGQSGSIVALRSTASNHLAYSFYSAYGDSITYGFPLSDPATQTYAALVAQANALPLTNRGVNGDQACDVPTDQIFAHGDSPTLTRAALYTLLISTNDVDVKGTGAYEAIFNACQQAAIAWLALPLEYKVLGSSSAVTTTGAVHVETQNNWNALGLDERNATASFSVVLSATGPVYAWYRISDGNAGTFTYALDGVVQGTARTGTSTSIATQNGRDNSMALVRLTGVSAGRHIVTFTQTSDGAYAVGIIAVGVPPRVTAASMPRVLVGTTPRQLSGSNQACGINDAPCQEYIADITTNVRLIAGDGLDVELFDSRKYMTGTSQDLADAVHPNVLGHLEIAQSLEDAL